VEVATDPKKRGAGKTVLVVDDSEVLRKTIEKAFLSDGFMTSSATRIQDSSYRKALTIPPVST
jgi:hypothetical protein